MKPKKLVNYGFGRLDTLLKEKHNFQKDDLNKENLIIIVPTYGENNLLKVCGIELIEKLLATNFKVLLRPHFRIFKESPNIIKEILEKFGENENFMLFYLKKI